jgi:SP family sugar:H+ symporter-like MFS transporter
LHLKELKKLTRSSRYDTGTISGIIAMKYWQTHGFADASNNYNLTASQDSLIVSILSAGTFFGALSAAPIADIIGRRFGLMVSCGIVFNLGVILQTASTHRDLFIAGRFFAGLGVGLVSAIIPMYQSETAPKWIRGTIVGAYQLAITIGLFLAAIVNNATKNRDDTGSYRIPIAGISLCVTALEVSLGSLMSLQSSSFGLLF